MISLIASTVIFITSFLVVLSLLVFFHELGHYSVARLFNVSVERFSIGFGRPIYKWRAKSGTEWAISRIPLGGYVKFLGDAGAASNPDTSQLEEIKQDIGGKYGDAALQNCFHFKPLWQRALIVLAGPVANFILAIVIFAAVVLMFGRTAVKSVVTDVVGGSAAEEAGVKVGDHFLTLDGHDVSEYMDFVGYVAVRSGVTMDVRVKRGEETVALTMTPRRQERVDGIGGKSNIGTAGVRVGGRDNMITRKYNPISALSFGTNQLGSTLSMTGTYVKRIFQGREDGTALGGPVRIATMTGKTAVDTLKIEAPLGAKLKYLFERLLYLAAALSVGLGVANLMPIPALDGGHLLYYGYEALAGRPLSEAKQEFGFRIGFAVLLTALVFLTINDYGYVRSMSS